MDLRQLGTSDLRISPIGIGAWAMGGGKWEWGWGSQNDYDSLHAIYEGLETGLNWIDTAAVYGLGHSETIVGRAIKNMPDRPTYSPSAAWSGTNRDEFRTACKPHLSAGSWRAA
jgi:aryl-alcohol dehydrogenase-like predicted oxidoreductase